MKVINIIGESETGKTRTIELIVKKLTEEGKNVGTVKHIHSDDFTLDMKGKDTWRHLNAGASTVVAITDSEIITIKRSETKNIKFDDILRIFQDQKDYIIIEGFKGMSFPANVKRVLCASEIEQIETFIKNFGKPDCIVTYSIKDLKEINGIPVLFMPIEAERLFKIIL